MPQLTELSTEDRAEVYQHLKQAIYHLVCVWDELRQVEIALHISIEVDDALSCCASGCMNAGDAFLISDEDLEELIKENELNDTSSTMHQ